MANFNNNQNPKSAGRFRRGHMKILLLWPHLTVVFVIYGEVTCSGTDLKISYSLWIFLTLLFLLNISVRHRFNGFLILGRLLLPIVVVVWRDGESL